MPTGPERFDERALEFLTDRHLATLATLRDDGTPHVVAVGLTWDPQSGLARVITNIGSQKVRNIERRGHAALTQIDGPRWMTLEGPARVSADADDVKRAEELYSHRYRTPRPNPSRVVIEVTVDRVLGLHTVQRPDPQTSA